MRPFMSLLLSLAMVITTLSAGYAHAQSGPTDHMVICTSAGAVIVYMDEDGTPTGPPHLCPDCALLLEAGVTDTPETSIAFESRSVIFASVAGDLILSTDTDAAARSPPPQV